MYKYSTWIVMGCFVLLMNGMGMAQTAAIAPAGIAPEAAAGKKIGRTHQMNGIVKGVDLVSKTLSIKNHRTEQSFVITPETKVKKGKLVLKLAELQVGTEVLVKFRELDGKKQAGIIKIKR